MVRPKSGFWLGWLLCLATLSLPSSAADKPQPVLVVFAAASLSNALPDLGAAFTRESGVPVHFTFGASSMLAKAIVARAPANASMPADVFVSASTDWMNYLRAHNAIKPASERSLVCNELVLVAPLQSAITLKIKPHFPLRSALGGGRLALADPNSVPAGRYARAALVTLEVWSDAADRLLPAENGRAALTFVSRGDAPLGIVYRTDVIVDHDVRIVDTFPAATHPPIVYTAALTVGDAPDAQAFIDYLRSPAAAAVFRKYGFTRER
jgi:molybdate transport system substrate-binding protein